MLAIGAAVVVGKDVLLDFPIWLFGAALTALPAIRVTPRLQRMLPLVTGVAALGALAWARVRPGLVTDYALGLAIALWVAAVVSAPSAATPTERLPARLAARAAAFSYTLYAVHLPFVIALRAALDAAVIASGGGPRLLPTFAALALFAAVLLAGLAWAFGVSRLTEARTPRLRRSLRRAFALER